MSRTPKTMSVESNTSARDKLIPVIPNDGPGRRAFMRSVADSVRHQTPSFKPDDAFEAAVERLFGDWRIDPASRLIVHT